MTAIDQIQIKYHAAADRLLLRISTTGATEFRFWLTRRFVKSAWPILIESLARTPHMTVAASPLARRELLAFEHERATTGADFSIPFRDSNPQLPMGPEPVVVVKLKIRPATDVRGCIIALIPELGRGIELTLTENLLHSFCALLARVLATTDWGIECSLRAPSSRSIGATLN
ncbi:MAG: hypothetical protein ACREXT_20205 [Gammaproteobacteria bacterium]